jgi:ElaB/YqjD/DUF883 family membrane-anchored ribosome-binding protein
MPDENDSALTGAAFELANAGYRPMPEWDDEGNAEAIGSDSASLREAAEQRAGSHDNITVREYIDSNGKPVAANEAVTLDRAGRDYARAVAADIAAMENESSTALAARVDALRSEAVAQDPDAAEFYGFEPLRAEADKSKADDIDSRKAASEPADPGDPETIGLDPEIEKVINHPQVRAAIEERISDAEQTRQDYLNGLAAATQIAQVSFLSQFPELASVAPENMPATLEQMSRQDPQKFARVQALVASTEQLFAQQRQESLHQAETARQNFHAYAKSEDARLETMLKGEPKATQHAVTAEIFASAKASGVEPAELIRLFNSEPLMRNAVFQRMMYDAGKYRLVMKARDAAAAKPVPPVQRPGMARTPGEREHADLRTLNARLSSSGDIRDAVALYNARKSSKR